MIERLEVEDLLEINASMCADTGENSVCLDRAGLEAAVERPWSGFGDHESFPTLYEKAAALLHAVAARQIFENGSKRTAWAAAVAFLDINGADIGKVETVQSDMFVRAAALDHSLEISDIAEWFRVAHEFHLHAGRGRPLTEVTVPGRGGEGFPFPADTERWLSLATALASTNPDFFEAQAGSWRQELSEADERRLHQVVLAASQLIIIVIGKYAEATGRDAAAVMVELASLMADEH